MDWRKGRRRRGRGEGCSSEEGERRSRGEFLLLCVEKAEGKELIRRKRKKRKEKRDRIESRREWKLCVIVVRSD